MSTASIWSSTHHPNTTSSLNIVDLDRGYLNNGPRALKQGDNLKRCEKRPLRGESDRVPGCIASFGIVVISNRYPGRIQESNVCCSRVITSQVPPGLIAIVKKPISRTVNSTRDRFLLYHTTQPDRVPRRINMIDRGNFIRYTNSLSENAGRKRRDTNRYHPTREPCGHYKAPYSARHKPEGGIGKRNRDHG